MQEGARAQPPPPVAPLLSFLASNGLWLVVRKRPSANSSSQLYTSLAVNHEIWKFLDNWKVFKGFNSVKKIPLFVKKSLWSTCSIIFSLTSSIAYSPIVRPSRHTCGIVPQRQFFLHIQGVPYSLPNPCIYVLPANCPKIMGHPVYNYM